MTPETMSKLSAQLVLDEGRRNKPYQDQFGKLTIGIGHNLTDNGLSDAVVDFIFKEDLAAVIADLDRELPWWSGMSESRQLVVADMCFNMGIRSLLGFHRTLAAMESGDFNAAADGMNESAWARQVPVRAARLINLMRTG